MKRLLLALIATANIGFAQTYQESGGLVVMEMENSPSALGLWQHQYGGALGAAVPTPFALRRWMGGDSLLTK